MGVFEQFPYSNYHDLNLDWILTEIKRLSETVATYDDHLAHLDSEIVRVEGKIPDVVQGPGYRTDAVMSQKAVTDAIAAFSGVRSIENYHQELGRLTPVRYFADQVYRFDEGHVGDFDTQEGGSCARYHIDDAEAPHIIITSGLDDPSDTRQLAAAAAFDVEIPTSTDIPLEIWTVPASEGESEISVDLPGGTVCVLVNSFTTSDPGMAKVLSGVWEWDGQPDNSVGSEALMTGAVTTLKISDGAVTPSKLSLNAVGESAIQDDAVTSGKIADGAVTNDKIASSAVTSAKLASDSVTAPKLADGAVRTAAFSAAARAPGVQIQTSTPVESLADNGYKIALLDSEPSTKYPGWVYMIKGTPAQGLPAASAADNGKVLGVVNGAWGKTNRITELDLTTIYGMTILAAIQQFITAALSNNGAYTTVHLTYDGTTHAEIQTAAEAMASGAQIYIKNGDTRIGAVSYYTDGVGYAISGYTYLKSASYMALVYMELGTQSSPETSWIDLAGFATTPLT